MNDDERRQRAHGVDATIRVGKNGVESVADELRDQLRERELVKVKFLRASRGGTSTDDLAAALASAAEADLVETRGHTATYY